MLNIALAGLAALTVVRGYNLPRQAPANGQCPTGVHVLAAGGGNGTDPSDIGRLGTLAQSIVNAIPGSDFVSVPFPKFDIRNNPQAVPAGNQQLATWVQEFTAACPNTKIVLIGYSAGGIITMNGICTGLINPDLAQSTVIATVVYGDQTRVAGQPWNTGTCVGAADQSGRLADKRNVAGCAPFTAGLQSYCDIDDPECCNGPPEDYNVHLGYQKYDQQATEWVVSRWNLLGNGNAADTTTSASSSVVPSTSVEPISSTVVVVTSTSTPAVVVPPTSSIPVPVETETTTLPSVLPTAPSTSLAPNDPNSAHAIFAPFSLVSAAVVATLIFGGAALL